MGGRRSPRTERADSGFRANFAPKPRSVSLPHTFERDTLVRRTGEPEGQGACCTLDIIGRPGLCVKAPVFQMLMIPGRAGPYLETL